MADGTIRIDTTIDTRKASAQLLSLQNQMLKTANKIGEIKTRMKEIETSGALDTSARELNAELERCTEALNNLQQEYSALEEAGDGTAEDFEAIADAAEEIRDRMAEINRQQGIQKEYTGLSEKLRDAQMQMTILGKRQKEVKTGSSALGNAFSAFGTRIAKLAKNVLIFSLVTKAFRAGLSAITEGLKNVAAVSGDFNAKMSNLQSSVAQLKASLSAAAAPIVEALVPAIIKLVDWLTAAINALGRFFAMLTGKSTYAKAVKQTKDFSGAVKQTTTAASGADKSIGQVTKGTDSLGDSMKKTAKEAKKARGELAAFDDLNVLNKPEDDIADIIDSNTPKTGDLGGGAGGAGTAGLPDPGELKEVQYELEPIGDTLGWIKELLSGLWDKFKEGFAFSFGDVSERLQGLIDYATRLKKVVGEIFGSPEVKNAAKEWAESLMYMLGAIVGMVASIGVSLATNIIGGLTQYLENNKERITDFIVGIFNISDRIHEIVANFAGAVAEIFRVFEGENAIKATENFIGIFADTFMGIVTLAGEIGADILDLLTRPIIENKEAIAEALDGMFGRLSVVLETLKSIVDQVWDSAIKTYREDIRPMLQWITEIISTIVGKLLELWNGTLSPILDGLAQAFSKVAEWTGLWEGLGKVIAYAATAAALIGTAMLSVKVVMTAVGAVISLVTGAVTALGAAIAFITSPIGLAVAAVAALIAIGTLLYKNWDTISEKAKQVFSAIKNTIEKALQAVADFIQKIIKTVSGWLKDLVKFVQTNILGAWTNAWNSIGAAVSNVFDGIKNTIKNAINFVIGIINGMIRAVTNGINFVIKALNSLSFTVPDWVPLLGGKTLGINIPLVNAPQIPTLATGGITTGATLAQIGEAGREAVLPLDQNTGWMEDLANVISRRDERPAIMQVDGRTFARLMMPYIDGENSRIGTQLSMA